jgi:hypothetical protein
MREHPCYSYTIRVRNSYYFARLILTTKNEKTPQDVS